MPWNFARLRHRHSIGEQWATAIARVANAPRDTGQPGDHRRFKRVLQQDGAVEFLGTQRARQTPLRPPITRARRGIVADHTVDGFLAGVDVGYPGASEQRDVRFRKTLANRANRRERHDGIAHPVCRADQDFREGHGATHSSAVSRPLSKRDCVSRPFAGEFGDGAWRRKSINCSAEPSK